MSTAGTPGRLHRPMAHAHAGQWEKDKFHGEGTYYYKNGDIYRFVRFAAVAIVHLAPSVLESR